MACFTDLDYRNKSYPLLQTIQAGAATVPITFDIPSYGCYDSMSDAAKMYQFYRAFTLYSGIDPVTENCFVQKTEDQQYFLTNESFGRLLGP
jgi:hypothetical protein